jgi:hypothetical protein
MARRRTPPGRIPLLNALASGEREILLVRRAHLGRRGRRQIKLDLLALAGARGGAREQEQQGEQEGRAGSQHN